ncbi:SusD/RagB family nutrient-binding outer membrane lipoprotein [Arcticibacter eurypsychrophilus]|uniref:SusD/RagB family nutrient-binding outer membrane lipoprotein n=1 Tax=Arcticibacter eurypsychrophilus TaxID=1434752 RepID=UPI00084D8940|nr:SusD/RagB family nutrient-binding outer membrane lipoprotein [Arcticibacter eurypsychrophilus]
MKKLIYTVSLFLLLTTLFSSCEKSLEEKYNNPDKTAGADIPGFFTAMLNNDRVRPSYWNVRTFLLMQPALYSQTAYFGNSNGAYKQNDSYVQQYWEDFYTSGGNGSGSMAMYRAMETAYASLPDAQKTDREIFMQAAKVVLYDQTSQMVDLWGDIPFSETGSLETSSTIINARFDDQVEVYNTLLSGLDEAATYFATATSTATFAKYDILSKGNVSKWQRYANSIRLRLLMRISNVNETTARTEVLKMLSNASQYPLIDGDNTGDYNPVNSDVLLMPLTNNTASLNSALTELPSHYAPDYMLNTVMLGSNDPRMPVMFDKFGITVGSAFIPNPTYRAMPITFTSEEQEANFSSYSILDSATFLGNPSLPGIVITASEVNFLKSEAYLRWGSDAEAKVAYENAVKQSISFYYYLNNLNTTGVKTETKPVTSVILDFVTTSNIAYSGNSSDKLAKIMTQKWLHFGFLQSTQAWSEYRRTGYPSLTFPATGKLAGFTTSPTRLLYPSSERTNNIDNYQNVAAKDTRTAKIFWDVN